MIVFDHVCFTSPEGVCVLDELSFVIHSGETVVICGRSGSGKSTSLRLMNGLLTPSKGNIWIGGKGLNQESLPFVREKMGFAHQGVDLFPHLTGFENIALPLQLAGKKKSERSDRVYELCELIHIRPEVLDRYPSEMSGGQKQRVGFARAIAKDPDILLLDEPFGGCDPITKKHLHRELKQFFQRAGKTTVVVSHDFSEAVELADRILLLEKGKLVQIDEPEKLLSNPADPFAREFLEAAKESSGALVEALQLSEV
ncbi:MAG: Choline transport ATP-binding protein OpuBA [Chlamydiia bacterium]|nr:Choline transport ATP-binding protein OpuBA [Chlamydiia bacterium]